MKFLRTTRYLVIVASIIIFFYQIKVALDNLMSENTLDSTENIHISDLDSTPVITFCPRQGEDTNKLDEWGFWNLNLLIRGQ